MFENSWIFKKLTEKSKKFRIISLTTIKVQYDGSQQKNISRMNFKKEILTQRERNQSKVCNMICRVSYRYFLDTHAIRFFFSKRENKLLCELSWFQFFPLLLLLLPLHFSLFPLIFPHKTIIAISKSFIQNEVIKKVILYILSIAIFN